MLEIDFHAHSLFSGCGVHTVCEMLSAAKARGMKALAITDHGPELGGRFNSVFFERLRDPVPGIRLLKGIEGNTINDLGVIDVPGEFLKYMDVVLVGIHANMKGGSSRDFYTKTLIAAIEQNRCIDVITHPNDPVFPVDLEKLALVAKRHDVALELNNSKIMLGKVEQTSVEELLCVCKRIECSIVVSSDAHTVNEVGIDDFARPYIKSTSFPEELIINRNFESAMTFVERKRVYKI